TSSSAPGRKGLTETGSAAARVVVGAGAGSRASRLSRVVLTGRSARAGARGWLLAGGGISSSARRGRSTGAGWVDTGSGIAAGAAARLPTPAKGLAGALAGRVLAA